MQLLPEHYSMWRIVVDSCLAFAAIAAGIHSAMQANLILQDKHKESVRLKALKMPLIFHIILLTVAIAFLITHLYVTFGMSYISFDAPPHREIPVLLSISVALIIFYLIGTWMKKI